MLITARIAGIMRFEFRVDMNLSGNREFYAVVEDAGLYEIQVNGSSIPNMDIGFWKDKRFRKIDIRKFLVSEWSWVERTSEADATEIFDRSKNYWTDSYSFVSFGLQADRCQDSARCFYTY